MLHIYLDLTFKYTMEVPESKQIFGTLKNADKTHIKVLAHVWIF